MQECLQKWHIYGGKKCRGGKCDTAPDSAIGKYVHRKNGLAQTAQCKHKEYRFYAKCGECKCAQIRNVVSLRILPCKRAQHQKIRHNADGKNDNKHFARNKTLVAFRGSL